LTKLAVALAILRLADQGRLNLDDELRTYVPDASAALPGVSIRRLITHSAGIPADFPGTWDYDERLTWPGIVQGLLQVVLDTPPGTRVMYDNCGYGLLGVVLERMTGKSFHQAVKDLVITPLSLDAYLGEEPPRLPIYLDDPADDNAGTPIELWNTPFWRRLGEPWGGMVASPASALALLHAFLGTPEGFLKLQTASDAIRDQAGGIGGGFNLQQWEHCPWGLGPEIITHNMHHWMEPGMPGGVIGHGGYSGCCVFYDPISKVSWSVHGTSSAATNWFPEVFREIRENIYNIAS